MNLLYRPQGFTNKIIFVKRRRYGQQTNYNFVSRVKWYPVGWGVNKRYIGNTFGKLHYLACHAPEPVRKRWWKAYINFQVKHFGWKGKASMRYLNKYSCYSWM